MTCPAAFDRTPAAQPTTLSAACREALTAPLRAMQMRRRLLDLTLAGARGLCANPWRAPARKGYQT
eukprot:CAMPEP_0172753834 /NCGR_PEP_ID=MMETSP1074-20121228/156774_1 /TAXON_ID=2916 /ORGANISM="Ceratium fusus, Strain PA161109" /LENGTH=65 /DNA_ID=CAMNT_0013586601 /DNA_START=59 /DNA_END=257 /DNA_ORIENTATION=-